MPKTSVNKWHFKTFDTIMRNISNKINIFNVKLAICLAFSIYLAKYFYLILIKILPHLLNCPDITKELRT